MARLGLALAIFAATFALLSAARFSSNEETLDAFVHLLSIHQPLSRNSHQASLGFSWKNCGSSSDPVQIHSASITDPIPIPGTLNFSVNFTFAAPIESPLKAEVTIQKKILGAFITVPCIENIGSCTYDDVCSLIPPLSECPPPLSTYGIPCQCPLKQGSYAIPSYSVDIPEISGLPSWLSNGDYHLKAALSTNGKSVGCYEAYVSLEAK
eukprot:m.38674 g.38674  ORF g.38674 m.38674 type:complete len:210 (+) comp32625_c0_seq1:64-693(+)